MELSYHSTSLARACPKKYYFSYKEKLEPVTISHALSLGKVIHDAFELYYQGKTRTDCLSYINTTFEGQEKSVGPEDEEKVYLNKCMALGMFLNYPNDLITFSDIQPEVKFSVPVGTHTLRGRVDGIVTQDVDKQWVREVKTTSLSMVQFAGRANRSYQTTGYHYGVVKTTGKPVEGVMYDVLRKAKLRKRKDEDKVGFGQRIMDFYADKKNHKYLYKRHYSYRNEDDIQRFEQDTCSLAEEMVERDRTGKYPRNTDNCWSWNRECEFAKICFTDFPDPLVLKLYYRKRTFK